MSTKLLVSDMLKKVRLAGTDVEFCLNAVRGCGVSKFSLLTHRTHAAGMSPMSKL